MIYPIRCCTCGKEKLVEASQPNFMFDLITIARNNGWIGIVDKKYRTLVFCSEECQSIQKNKNGTYRKRLIKKEIEND